ARRGHARLRSGAGPRVSSGARALGGEGGGDGGRDLGPAGITAVHHRVPRRHAEPSRRQSPPRGTAPPRRHGVLGDRLVQLRRGCGGGGHAPEVSSTRRVTLILLPGLDGTDIFFRPLLAALPPWIEAHCVEYPVSGPNDYRDLLPLVRNACQACEEFFLLGWSFSGPLALMLAAESPAALRGVVLCASFISPPWPFIRALRLAATASVARFLPFVSRALAMFGRYSSDDFVRDRAECWSRVPPSALAARARRRGGRRPRTSACSAPPSRRASTRCPRESSACRRRAPASRPARS